MSNQSTVLIIDSSDETREVLKTALEYRGYSTRAASRAALGLEVARQVSPAIIVLSLEAPDSSDAAVSSGFRDHASTQKASLVVIGSAKRDAKVFPQAEFVSAPYHFGPLIRRIEELSRARAAGPADLDVKRSAPRAA